MRCGMSRSIDRSSPVSGQDRLPTVLAAHSSQHPVNIISSETKQFLLTPAGTRVTRQGPSEPYCRAWARVTTAA